jgi:uracil-DNA glycosylase family 4
VASGAQLKLAGEACATCPARGGRCIPPEPAAQRAKLVVLGDSPSRADAEAGRPFAGSSGRFLARGLRTLGLSRADVHWTNAVLCDCRGDEKLVAKARVACAARLRSELAASGAPVVMPLGSAGLHSVLTLPRKPQLLKWRGSVSRAIFDSSAQAVLASKAKAPHSSNVIETSVPASPKECDTATHAGTEGGGRRFAWVLPTIHPSMVQRAPKWGPILEIDVARVGRVMREGFMAPEDHPARRLVVPQTIAELREALGDLARGRDAEASFDVETVGLGPTYTALVCYGLSDGELTVVVPWSRASNGQESYWVDGGSAAREATNQVLARVATVTHNGPAFDNIVAARYGLAIKRQEDTLLGAHALSGHMPKNLAHVVTLYLDVPPWKQLEDRGVNIERLWVYNGRDCLYTMLARREQKRELAAS